MVKLTPLVNVANLQDTTTSQNTLAANNASLTTAFNNTLSLDGSAPNQMQANLDMNSNHLLNLPPPSSATEPLRVGDIIPTGFVQTSLTGDITGGPATGPIATTVAKIQGVTVTGTTGTAAVVFNNSPTIGQPVITGSFTATNLVTNASLAQVTANSVKGNNTGGTANVTDLSMAQLATMMPSPQVTILTSGSSSYSTPANAKYLVVELVGGGGGGGGSGTGSPGGGTTGNNTTFGTSFLTANGGTGGSTSTGTTVGGTGGTATGGDINISGSNGGGGIGTAVSGNLPGGAGASSYFGGGGVGGSINNTTGIAGATNSGSGGGGGAGTTSFVGGGGGASGGYCKKTIFSPSASYNYSVAASVSGGGAGTSGFAGGGGAAGLITVVAYFI